jgi:hypothetical protein
MALVIPIVVLLVLGSLHMSRRGGPPPEALRPLVMLGIVAFSLFALTQLAANLFGSDRDGFRALVLLPVARWKILLAKNLALLPLSGLAAAALLVILTLVWGSPVALLLASALQFLSGYLLLSVVGNYTSVRAPFRVAPGSLKPTKTSAKTTVLLFVLYLLFPLAMLPLALPLGIALLVSTFTPLPFAPLNLVGSALLLIAVGAFYGLSLPPAGRYLQAREREILQLVTSAVE